MPNYQADPVIRTVFNADGKIGLPHGRDRGETAPSVLSMHCDQGVVDHFRRGGSPPDEEISYFRGGV